MRRSSVVGSTGPNATSILTGRQNVVRNIVCINFVSQNVCKELEDGKQAHGSIILSFRGTTGHMVEGDTGRQEAGMGTKHEGVLELCC